MLRIVLGFAVCAMLAMSGGAARAANTATMGMAEGDPAKVACPGKQYLAGVNLWWDTSMSGLAPYCVAMAPDGAWQGGAAIHLDRMMSEAVSGKRLDLFCPRDFYLFGFSGHSHVYGIHSIMQLKLICRNVKSGALWGMGTTYPDGVAVTEWPGGQCPDDSVATGVFGNVNSARIIRFGLTCAKTQPAFLLSQMVTVKPEASLKALTKKKKSDMVVALPEAGISSAMQAPDTGTTGSGLKSSAILKQPGILDSAVAGSAGSTPTAPEPTPATLPASQAFAPPLAKSGRRLYACQALDSDVCGRPVADVFCQQQGFARTESFGTDRIKGPVETIGGQTCTKKKCKTFEEIVCVR